MTLESLLEEDSLLGAIRGLYTSDDDQFTARVCVVDFFG